MNSNHVDGRPTTITAAEFVEGGYAAKIARGECVVKDKFTSTVKRLELYPHHFTVVPVEADTEKWIGIEHTQFDVFTVEWLAQPATDRDAAAPLLPQTVRTIRYGTPEFEQLSRDDAEAEIKRLQAINAKLYAFVSSFESCSYSEHGDFVKARELEIWHEKAQNLKAEIDDSEPDHR